MPVKIVFAVQSAVHRVQTLRQLARTLEDHTVLVHHDFAQTPEFPVNLPNVRFVPDPVKTGWGTWGMMQAILKTIDFALNNLPFDYLQVLTPVDMPIKPVSAFEAMVAANDHDVAIDTVSLSDPNVFMSFAYRAWARKDSAAFRALWFLHRQYFGDNYATEPVAGLALPKRCRESADGTASPRAKLALRSAKLITRALEKISIPGARPTLHAGAAWFGVNLNGARYLTEQAQLNDVQARFKPFWSASEMLPATVFANSDLRLAPANHVMSRYDVAHPVWLTEKDLPALRRSGRYFARKFPDDPQAPVRQALLASLQPVART